jgi:hypothetical protein
MFASSCNGSTTATCISMAVNLNLYKVARDWSIDGKAPSILIMWPEAFLFDIKAPGNFKHIFKIFKSLWIKQKLSMLVFMIKCTSIARMQRCWSSRGFFFGTVFHMSVEFVDIIALWVHKTLAQISHLNGLSPVWVTKCRLNSVVLGKGLR